MGKASIRGTRRVKRAGVQSSEVKALLEKSVEIERLCGIPTSRFVQPFDASHNRNLRSLDSAFVHQQYSWHIFHQLSTAYLSSDVKMAIIPRFSPALHLILHNRTMLPKEVAPLSSIIVLFIHHPSLSIIDAHDLGTITS